MKKARPPNTKSLRNCLVLIGLMLVEPATHDFSRKLQRDILNSPMLLNYGKVNAKNPLLDIFAPNIGSKRHPYL